MSNSNPGEDESLELETHETIPLTKSSRPRRKIYAVLRSPYRKDRSLSLTTELSEDSPIDEVAAELATLCKALNAYHIACGGNGLEIDDWENLVAVRELAGV